MTEILVTENLVKAYDRKIAVRRLSLAVGAGQVFGLLGPNGSGKTTTLGMLLGTIRPDSGSFRWFGAGRGARERRRIGSLLEQPSFYPWLSGDANLKVVSAVKKLPASAIEAPLKTVGLWDARMQPFQTYSLGMKQRLAIAAALLGRPDALLLDEPTNGVDAQGIVDIRSIIKEFAKSGGTVILASHLLDEVEKVCTDVAILKDGAIVKAGTTRAILATNGWIEVGASDLEALAVALRTILPDVRVQRGEGCLEVHDSRLTTAEINRRLAESGVIVGHLVQRQPSLESQYLELVGEVRT